MLDPVGLASHPFLAKLGPDLLDPDQSMRDLIDHVTSGRFDRRRLDHLLLDQAFLAGVGNYLRSEILFESGLHPRRKLGALSTDERTRLVEQARTVTQRALDHNGVTVDPALAVRLKEEESLDGDIDTTCSRGTVRHVVDADPRSSMIVSADEGSTIAQRVSRAFPDRTGSQALQPVIARAHDREPHSNERCAPHSAWQGTASA